MPDMALQWSQETGSADMYIVDDDVAGDDGLRTAVIISLYTDRRAEDDDSVPGASEDRRGWWGDEFAEKPGDRIGSRRWLLERGKIVPDIGARLESYAKEALAWMVEDRVADRVDVGTVVDGSSVCDVVTISRPGRDDVTFRFDHVWRGESVR